MNPRAATPLSPLDIAEYDDIPFLFGDHMNDDETIVSAAVTAELKTPAVDDATDPSAQDMVDGDYAIGTIEADGDFTPGAGTTVLQRFKAVDRPLGNVYDLRCTVLLSSGRKLTAAGHIAVKRL